MRLSPGTRLVLLSAFTAIAVSSAALSMNLDSGIYYLCVLSLIGIALFDLYISLSLNKQLSFIFPKIVRMAKNRETLISFQIKKQTHSIKQIKIGIVYPSGHFKTDFENNIILPGKTTSVNWPVTGLKQGAHLIDTCHFQISSRLGLWDIKTQVDIHCELNVYPDMSREQKNLAALFTGTGYGVHAQKSIGKGREFEHLREYLPGDNYEDIHWKATAKRSIPVTKIFQLERTQDVYVMIDASRLSARNATQFSAHTDKDTTLTESILEKYITTTLSMGMTAQKQGDNFGLGVFTDKMDKFLTASSKKSHYNLCRDTLFTLEPRQVTPDFNEWITFVGNKIRKRSLLILLTNLDDPAVAENLLDHIHILSRRHLVMVNMLKPVWAQPLFSSDHIQSTDDIYQHLGGHLQWHFLSKFEKSLRRMGIGFYLHTSPELTFNMISQYLEIKQRQAL